MSSYLLEPGLQEAFDVAAATGSLEAPGDPAAVDDDERRHRLDLEVLEQIRALFLGDMDDVERPVVPSPLQNLSEEPLDAPTMAGQCRVKEDQPGLVYGLRGQSEPPIVLKGEDLALG